MPQLSGPYDSGSIQPVAQIGQNLMIYSLQKWTPYVIVHMMPIPAGPASILEAVSAAGSTSLAAKGTVTKRVVTILQLNDNELLQVRAEPIDDVEAVFWELSGQQAFASRNIHARVSRNTRLWDDNMSGTTLFIIGQNRDMQLEVDNPLGYAVPSARIMFWGIRYIVKPYVLPADLQNSTKIAIAQGDPKVIKDVIGPVTYILCEGRQS